MSREYAIVQVEHLSHLCPDSAGVYKTEDIGRTRSTRNNPDGFLVQSWRQIIDQFDHTKLGRTLHVVRVPADSNYLKLQCDIALCFFVDESSENHRYKFLVLDRRSTDTFVPSRRTHDFSHRAHTWWDNGIAPILGSHVDSLITS